MFSTSIRAIAYEALNVAAFFTTTGAILCACLALGR